MVTAIALLLPLLLLTFVLLALRSETGTAWVIEQVPGLEVQAGQGSLLGRWQATSLSWRGDGVDVQVQAPDVQWSPRCLLQKQLCVDHLRVHAIELNLQPSANEDDSPKPDIQLPDIDLPLGIRADQIRLGEFFVNSSKIWDAVELDADGVGEGWLIDRVFYQRDDIQLTVSGQVQTRGDWPVDLGLSAVLPPPSGERWKIDLALTGSVRNLRVGGSSQGYLNAILEGRVEPLQADLPVSLNIRSDLFLAAASLPPTLTLNSLKLALQGSLADGFETSAQATLPGTSGPVELTLAGTVTTQGADNIELTLAANNAGRDGTLALTGSAAWLPELAADANLTMNAFPWYTLLPDMQEPPVNIDTLQLRANWQDQRYTATLVATAGGPAGNTRLESELEGDLQQLTVSRLQVQTGAGNLVGNASVGLAQPLSWQATLEMQKFNPGYWMPQWQASLDGSIRSSGQWPKSASVPEMSVEVDLAGLWRGQTTFIKIKASGADGLWQVPQLNVAIGDNTLAGKGQWGQQLHAELDLNLPEPEAILESLRGQASARLTVTGTVQQPQADIRMSATALAWADRLQLAGVDFSANLDAAGAIRSRLQARGIAAGGQTVEQLEATLEGTRQNHELVVEMNHREVDVHLGLVGAAGEQWQQWQGELRRGEVLVTGPHQRWQLRQPAGLFFKAATASAEPQLTFAEHCWQWQQSSLCAGNQTLLPAPDIEYRISNLSAQALAPLLPKNLRWQADINGRIDFSMAAGGSSGAIELDAGAGNVDVLLDGDWETLRHSALSIRLTLQPSDAQLMLALAGPKLGSLKADLSIDPTASERTLSGDFQLSGMDIALLGLFTGLEEVAGQINGRGELSGPLMRPAVNGELTLSDGRVIDPRLPLAMEQINVTVNMLGYNANLKGVIRANERRELVLQGEFDWQSELPSGSVSLRGERLPINIEPYAELYVAPDLTVAFTRGELSVNGRIDVPSGAIEIRGLPPRAVSVSDDEVIVGVEKPEPVIRSLMMDVVVRVGSSDDKVTFAAFGATGDLSGTLRIGNTVDTRGTLRLNKGRFEAYGQDLTLRKARLLFVGNLSQPYLELEAVRTVGSVVAGLRLKGLVQSPETEVFSSPEMPQTDALSYLILGRAPRSEQDDGQMSRAALSLGLNQANKIAGALGAEFGIRDLTLEAEGSGDQTAVVASGYLTDELSIRYGVGIFVPVTTVALRYDLGRYFYLEAASGLAASLDIFYTRDF
jgi:translocation and assembly module TamB